MEMTDTFSKTSSYSKYKCFLRHFYEPKTSYNQSNTTEIAKNII